MSIEDFRVGDHVEITNSTHSEMIGVECEIVRIVLSSNLAVLKVLDPGIRQIMQSIYSVTKPNPDHVNWDIRRIRKIESW